VVRREWLVGSVACAAVKASFEERKKEKPSGKKEDFLLLSHGTEKKQVEKKDLYKRMRRKRRGLGCAWSGGRGILVVLNSKKKEGAGSD